MSCSEMASVDDIRRVQYSGGTDALIERKTREPDLLTCSYEEVLWKCSEKIEKKKSSLAPMVPWSCHLPELQNVTKYISNV